ncbi:MAG TPA: glycosyltransferase family 1 protein [Bryobacteraceae bacterium]|nr:glycosyltransferase family 1 protein [Bryobacteraceae bacterium]
MRIALDATYSVDPNPSGIAVYSQELLAGLTRSYPEDEFLFCYRWKQWRRSLGESHAPNVRRRLLQPPLPIFKSDLFHGLNQRVDRRTARRVISTFHDLFVLTGDYSSPEFRARFSHQARAAAENSDMIIAVSAFTASQVSDLLGVERSRIRVVPHGVNLPDAPSSARRESIILSVGALQLRKNTIGLVQAFEHLPEPWRLVLAGSPTGYRADEVLSRIQASPQRDRIQVTGYLRQDELDRLYRRACIFAFPSLDEGFGMPVLEAMAHGIPVVTSDRSAMPEVAGDAALLVNPAQTEEIEAALRKLIENETLRQKLSNAGQTRAALYSWDGAVRKTHAAYQELV